ncbi:MAG TPA: beta-propeller fold lactonase family protein [Syntrophorhabdales bacterium]|nr:beta-propeller fold lactonase family protein [Syntrophorhabdales bacterium]
MNKKIWVGVLTATILMISTVVTFAESPQWGDVAGAVYTMTNDSTGNKVVVFTRDEDGILTKAGSMATGGTGSGGGLDPLGSQGSLVLSQDHRWLLAVNAGSNEISVFKVWPEGLDLVDKVGSGGNLPVSLTVFHDLVYVLNAGTPNITGFYLSHTGHLIPLDHSTRSLSGGFAQVGFDPEGETLVVTDKADSKILVYSVGDNGLPGMNPVTSLSNGVTPFGFIFDQWGHLLVVEVGNDAVSSYSIRDNGMLQVISGSVANGQKAACWIAGNERGYIFTANPGSGTISNYKLKDGKGNLALLNGKAGVGSSPLDLAIAADGRFLYAVDPASGGIDMFQIEHDGSLTHLGTAAGGLSMFAQGIAAR